MSFETSHMHDRVFPHAGTLFEGQILSREKDNPKFNFLRTADPYHAYYRHMVGSQPAVFAVNLCNSSVLCVSLCIQQAGTLNMQVTEIQKGTDGAKPVAAAQPDQQTAEQQQLAAGPAAGAVAVEPPEEEKYSIHVPEGLTYFDLDLIKMTAQFVARNGKGFLTGALPSLSLAKLKLVSASALQGSMIILMTCDLHFMIISFFCVSMPSI